MSTIVPLEVPEDEILMISYTQVLSAEEIEGIQKAWDAAIKSGKKIMILCGDPSLHVVKRESLNAKR